MSDYFMVDIHLTPYNRYVDAFTLNHPGKFKKATGFCEDALVSLLFGILVGRTVRFLAKS